MLKEMRGKAKGQIHETKHTRRTKGWGDKNWILRHRSEGCTRQICEPTWWWAQLEHRRKTGSRISIDDKKKRQTVLVVAESMPIRSSPTCLEVGTNLFSQNSHLLAIAEQKSNSRVILCGSARMLFEREMWHHLEEISCECNFEVQRRRCSQSFLSAKLQLQKIRSLSQGKSEHQPKMAWSWRFELNSDDENGKGETHPDSPKFSASCERHTVSKWYCPEDIEWDEDCKKINENKAHVFFETPPMNHSFSSCSSVER